MKPRGNAIVGQSGGPTAVINQSLVGVIESVARFPEIGELLGARHGVSGILNSDFIPLKGTAPDLLDAVANTPSAALGSVRKKPSQEECLQMFEVMRRHDVRYFFYIGGNDSAETAHIIQTVARTAGYDLRCIHVPKTIDNDLLVTDHCPGYGSAARFVASAIRGSDLDNRSLPGIKIDIIMGRHAGYLAAASALARIRPDDGPHLIYLPERPVTIEKILEDVEVAYKRFGRCLVAVSEGIVNAASPTHATFSECIKMQIATLLEEAESSSMPQNLFDVIRLIGGVERDGHGNIQLSGSGLLGDWLSGSIRHAMGPKTRVRADTLGYLQRSFSGIVSPSDAKEAREVGRKAVEYAVEGDQDGSVVIIRRCEKGYCVDYSLTDLSNVAKNTRSLPDLFIADCGTNVTPAFLEYARPLAGTLAPVGWFDI